MRCIAFIFSVLFMAANFYCGCSGYQETFTESQEDRIIYQKYFEMDKNLKSLVNSGAKRILPYILEANERINLSSSCRRDILLLFAEIRKLKLSALSFLDAIGKVPEGILTGSINMVGDYDQCLNASISRRDGSMAFRGQYCMLHLSMLPKQKLNVDYSKTLENLLQATKNTSEVMQLFLFLSSKLRDIPVKVGLCVPSGCSAEDIDQTVRIISDTVGVNADLAYCEVRKDVQFSPGRIVAISIFSLLGMLLVIGTFLDYYARNNNIKLQAFSAKLLMCFSVMTNFPKVISTKDTDSPLMCLYGVRVLSMFYIMLQHHYMAKAKVFFEAHTVHYFDDFQSFFFQIVTSMMVVDIFFLLGGITHSYSRMKAKGMKRNTSFIQIIIHRLWRLYPALLVATLLMYIFNDFRGPMRHYLYRYIENCDSNWWKNVLFITNFFHNDDMCLLQAWYVAADMHLFLLALFIFPVFFRNAKKGIILSVAIVCIGLCSAVAWGYHKNVTPGIDLYNVNLEITDRYRNAYGTTFSHIAPYFTGIILGFILHSMKDLKLPRIVLLFGWPIAGVAFTSMLFITKRWNSGVPSTRVESAIYFAFGRFLYASAVGWMILCCSKGYGGIINYILSLKIWVPLSRLTYMMFLVSPTIQIFFFGNLRMPFDGQLMISIWHYLAEVVVSCLLCLVLVVATESPFLAIEKLLLHRDNPDEKKCAENGVEAHDNSAFDERNPKSVELDMNMKNGDTIQVKL